MTEFEDDFLDLFNEIEENSNFNEFLFDSNDKNNCYSDGETSSSSSSCGSSYKSSSSTISTSPSLSISPTLTTLPYHNNHNNNNNHQNNNTLYYDFNLPHNNNILNNNNNNNHLMNDIQNNLILHKTTPLLSTQKPNKRMKKDNDEDRLIKNRESANRSRMKRKNEKLEMEETIAELKNRIKTLELENTALLADNTSLNNQNLYLRSLLSNCEVTKKPTNLFNGTISGVTVLCLVCMCTVFNDWLPPILNINTQSNLSPSSSSSSSHHRPSGRVLLSMHDMPSIHIPSSSSSYSYSHGIESSPQSYIKMGLLIIIVLCYFGYLKYIQKNHLQKNGWILP